MWLLVLPDTSVPVAIAAVFGSGSLLIRALWTRLLHEIDARVAATAQAARLVEQSNDAQRRLVEALEAMLKREIPK